MAGAADWADALAPSLEDFERLARDAFAGLPDRFRALCGDLVFVVQDFPDEEVVHDMALDSPFDILGLYQGIDIGQAAAIRGQPDMVFLYRRPILDYWAEHDERLGHVIAHVLIHEIGHHFGLSDEAMHAIEDGAG